MTPAEILAAWDAAVEMQRIRERALLDPSVPMAEFTRIAVAYDHVAESAVNALGGWLVASTPQAVAHGRAR